MKPLLLTTFLLAVATVAFGSDMPAVQHPPQIPNHFAKGPKLRVVNFWATWCVPCVAEMKDLQTLDATFDDRDVELVGISLDDALPGDRAKTRAKVERFLTSKAIRYKNIYYTGKLPELLRFYRFDGEIPITIILDGKGKEISRHQGVIDRAKVTKELRELLKRSTPKSKTN